MERELPREAWRTIFRDMDATIERVLAHGLTAESAWAKIASYALAKQAEAAAEQARKG